MEQWFYVRNFGAFDCGHWLHRRDGGANAFTRLSFPARIERVGAVLLLVLIETAIGFGTY
jgi:hypothetical protein